MLATVELVVGDDPEVLSRVVRVSSTRPFALEHLHYWRTPGRENRVLIDVVVNGRSELLGKRLNRVVSVQRVRVLDERDTPPPRKHRRNAHIVRSAD